MNWHDDKVRITALKLLLRGVLRRSPMTGTLIDELDDIGIVVPTRRDKHYQLVAGREGDYRSYLAVRWPDYVVYERHFTVNALRLEAANLRTLRRAVLESPAGFTRLNRKTWSAWAGANSKSGEANPPAGLTLTTDDILRARVNNGLCLCGPTGETLDLGAWQMFFNETILPERAFDAAWTLAGVLPDLILTVENLGAFVDIQKPDDCLLLHSPGWNNILANRFVARLPSTIPWLHFGDIDPEGLRIARAFTAAEARKPEIWIPRTAATLLETHALTLAEPWSLSVTDYPTLANETLQALMQSNRWLEQEAMVLLPGFAEELRGLCQR